MTKSCRFHKDNTVDRTVAAALPSSDSRVSQCPLEPLRRLVFLLINPFFGVFPGHVGQLSCVLRAYLWRPSVINIL